MTSSISFMIKSILTFGRPKPASVKPDYSWMDLNERSEWERLRAAEMEMFDADAQPGNKTIFHHPV